MSALGERIAALIAAEGPMSLAQFMTLALHDREAGFYATRVPLGADFITAPEISQMFGELVGLWLAQVWSEQGKPPNTRLVELGPGRGTLMADALRALKLVPEFRASLEVVLVEASPTLRELQAKTLADTGAPVRFVKDFAAIEHDRPLFVVANEFFDALPIQQFVKTESGWCERMVCLAERGNLALALSPPLRDLSLNIPRGRADAPLGGVFEVSKAAIALVEDISHFVADAGGAALIVDYGYEAVGFGETLQAVAANRQVDVLSDPGTADLSAHVDFAALRLAASQGGAEAYGPVEQGKFLTALGIEERAWRLSRNDPTAVEAALERLIAPDEMGRLFKALAILPKTAPAPPGF